jgi:hypothetical protein
VLNGVAQRRAHLALGEGGHRAQQRIGDVAPGGRGHTQQALRAPVEPADARRQRLAQAAREGAVSVSRGGEQFLGEERVALGASDDRVRHRRRERVGPRRQQRPQLVAGKRTELEQARRARAPDTVREPAHPLRRCRLVRPLGRHQHDAAIREVVREVDDEIEARCIGPVEILEHQEYGRDGRVVAEQRERLLEHPEL